MHKLENSPDKPYDLIVTFKDCQDARDWMNYYNLSADGSPKGAAAFDRGTFCEWNDVTFLEAEKIFPMDWCKNIFINHKDVCI